MVDVDVISFYKLVVSFCWDVCWIWKSHFINVLGKSEGCSFFGFTWWSTFGTFYKLAGLFIL